MIDGISFTNKQNNLGPKQVPCGTQLSNWIDNETLQSVVTLSILPVRYSQIQVTAQGPIL